MNTKQKEKSVQILEHLFILFSKFLLFLFLRYTDHAKGFVRKIQPEEYWLYKFPKTDSYYPSHYLWVSSKYKVRG